MKKALLFITMAAALLFTQCRKQETLPVAPEAGTVRMTVTAGPGSKTDITDMGRITWSAGDKLYVGDGSKYIGYLTLMSDEGTPAGTFSGDVTLTGITDGAEQTFHFFYLGSADYTGSLTSGTSTSVEVDFSSQEIYADNGTLKNAGAYHVGYGKANGTVSDGVVTGINVTLVSKVTLARFSFKKGEAAYEDALTLSGANIYNKMTVSFDGNFTGKDGSNTDGITLAAGHSERYVMLVPTGATTAQTLTFTGSSEAGTGKMPSLLANQFYGRESAIPVTLKVLKFSVGNNVKVAFSPGNLYWDGSAFKFETSQTAYTTEWNEGHVDRFLWSPDKDVAVGTSTSVSGTLYDVFFTNDSSFQVNGEEGWRTLSKDEWVYLLNTDGSSGRTDANRFAKARVNGVQGLLIFPDGYSGTTSDAGIAEVNNRDASFPTGDISTATWDSMESAGVVFLPAAGYRIGSSLGNVGSHGYYWSLTLNDIDYAYDLFFYSGIVNPRYYENRRNGGSVRLVW